MNEEVTNPNTYISSTVEKKRAIAALFFMGIVMMLAKQQELSVFERYYLSLSLSLWTLWFVIFFTAIIVFFVASILWYLFVLVLLFWFGVRLFSIQQARQGTYNHSFVVMKLLVWLGERLLSLFGDESWLPSDPSVS